MKQIFYLIFPPFSIYNPDWVRRLPTGSQQVWSLYGLIALLSLLSGLAGFVFSTYLPMVWLFAPLCFSLATVGTYRLLNRVLTEFRQALLQNDWQYCCLLVSLPFFASIFLAHLFSLVIFGNTIRLAELQSNELNWLGWQLLSDSRLLFRLLFQPPILLLWVWVQAVTQLLVIIPFLLLFLARNSLHAHLYYVQQNRIEQIRSGRA